MESYQTMPVVLITGASGNIGSRLRQSLSDRYRVVGLDLKVDENDSHLYACDLTDQDSIHDALATIGDKYGRQWAAVIHLAAYFDFSGEDHPLYKAVNEEGTRKLLDELQSFDVQRFLYSSTMLVHAPATAGQKVSESSPLKPGWAYPKSKARTESLIKEHHGKIPYVLLRLAGLYDESSAVPTLSHQIARIYERKTMSHLYSGDVSAGQAFIHIDDLFSAFAKVLDKRLDLPETTAILFGEEQVMSYQALQNRIGKLIHGEEQWATVKVPETVAKPGAWLQEKAEPVVPDVIDQGEKPFIKPFMIDLSSDHYDLDIRRAKSWLGWLPQRDIWSGLESIIASLKDDPVSWYQRNDITPPEQFQMAKQEDLNVERVRASHELNYRREHRQSLWAHFITAALACWLLVAPFTMGYESRWMTISDVASGSLLLVTSMLSLSWRMGLFRWVSAAIGLWLLSAPLIFWTPTAAAYANGTLVGMLVMGFSLLLRPMPGISALAAESGPSIPPGWDYSPSDWFQRMPIIILAVFGFLISRYLCAYQLGHIDQIWDPFFLGAASTPQNGTEEIITSSVSKAWPVPDAGLGALTYALEILTGLLGSSRRWRTMPWMVMAFGFMIVPLGAVSIFFIVIQPIVIGTWCTLCLIAAAAMLIQIPYSLDEVIASGEFLYRRKKAGRSFWWVFFRGDTDEGSHTPVVENFEQSPKAIFSEMLGGGITLPWTLVLCLPIGVWLMFTRLTLGHSDSMANVDHLVGSLVLTVVVTAFAESARTARFLLIPLGLIMLVAPWIYGVGLLSIVASWICGVLLIALSLPKGPVRHHYGRWDYCIT